MLKKILGWIKGERSQESSLQVKVEIVKPEASAVKSPKEKKSTLRQPDPVCPHCGYRFEEMPKRRRKCPQCRKEVVVRSSRGIRVLMSAEESWRLDAERREALDKERLFNLLHSVYFREPPAKTLLRIERKRSELLHTSGKEVAENEVVWNLLNEARKAARPNDLVRQRDVWSAIARYQYLHGQDCHEAKSECLRMQLGIWREMSQTERVKIISYCDCLRCREVDGKTLTVQEALEQMPLPVKDCQKGNTIMGTYSLVGASESDRGSKH